MKRFSLETEPCGYDDIMINRSVLLKLIVLTIILSAAWASLSSASTTKDAYAKAESCYHKLLNSPEKQKLRHNWLQCIDQYQAVYKAAPDGSMASDGLYMSGYLYDELYRISFKPSDKKEAIDCYERIIKRYPKSSHISKAREAIDRLSNPKACKVPQATEAEASKSSNTGEESSKVSTEIPVSSCPPASGYSHITGLRVWSNPSYTRIVINADKETSYKHKLLKKDKGNDKPQRLYIDFDKSKLSKKIKSIIPINDDLLVDARAGQFTLESVRVVVDIKSFKTYKIFSLNNPFRIILDIWGSETAREPAMARVSKGHSPEDHHAFSKPKIPLLHKGNSKITLKKGKENSKNVRIAPSALAKQLALGVNRIIIDPGHGGKDFGASGIVKGVYEKDITLAIAKKLAVRLREELHCEVILTRTTDRYLTLEERTALANTKNADLFISIHCNAAKNHDAYGIETFFLNLATDDDSIMVAARENATSTKNISDLQSILSDLMQNAKVNESSRLAASIQDDVCRELGKKYNEIKNKGVKKAPFYVLLGAQMPSVLVETSFLSNERECRRLTSSEYQTRICDAIADGVARYVKDTNPTAFYERQHQRPAEIRGVGENTRPGNHKSFKRS